MWQQSATSLSGYSHMFCMSDMSIRDVPNAGEVYPVWNMCGECEAQRSRDQKCLARNFSLTGSGNCRLRYVRLCRGIIRGVPEAGKMYPV